MGNRNGVEEMIENDEGLIVSARLRRRSWGMPYGRIEVTDVYGRRAWTNPLWQDAG